jgi:hypothetical protein
MVRFFQWVLRSLDFSYCWTQSPRHKGQVSINLSHCLIGWLVQWSMFARSAWVIFAAIGALRLMGNVLLLSNE